MRKEVKKAVVVWPIAISVAILVSAKLAPIVSLQDRVLRKSIRSSRIDSNLPTNSLVGQSIQSAGRHAIDSLLGSSISQRGRTFSVPDSLAALPAPVVDSNAELAGFGGPTSMMLGWFGGLTPAQVPPSPLAPGVSASIDGGQAQRDILNRVVVSGPVAKALLGLSDITTRLSKPTAGDSTMRRWLPIAAVDSVANQDSNTISSALIPKSVETLARPAFRAVEENSRSRDGAGKTRMSVWPIAKQLRLDLSTLSEQADLARSVIEGAGLQFASAKSSSDRWADDATAFRLDNVPDLAKHDQSTPMQRAASAIIIGRWADQVDAKLSQLHGLTSLADRQAGELIQELSTLAEAGLQLGEALPARDQQIHWMRTAHALSRRASVWGSVWELSQREPQLRLASQSKDVNAIPSLVDEVRSSLPETGDVAGWNQFLLLDEIERIPYQSNADQRSLVAQRFLSRLNYQGLSAAHVRWLKRGPIAKLAAVMHPLTIKPVDYVTLLSDIERQESNSIDLASLKVTDAFQSLRFTDQMPLVRVAKAIDVNYRNANVRTAISSALLDRLVPTLQPKREPLSKMVLGNRLVGETQTQTELDLELVPSDDTWRFNLVARGNVRADGRTSQSGVTIHTTADTMFDARTPIEITSMGTVIGDTTVDVQGGSRLRGIDTRVDGWPLLGSLVQSIAKRRYLDIQPSATRVGQNEVRREILDQTQTRLSSQVDLGQTKIDQLILGPLGQLNLNPRVIDQRTTSSRLIARFRVAGDWQLAAHTPRPRAYSDSWMSVQMHQTALNNLLERLLPRGNAQSLQLLVDDTRTLFGGKPKPLPAEIPGEAEICFANTRPITLEIEDDRVWVTFRVVSLTQPGSPVLRRFIVRAAYRGVVDGLDARLIRDGHLRISGPGMSMRQRLPVRAVFNKVLAEDRALPLTLPALQDHPALADLVVTQLEMRDGWIAWAIGPEGTGMHRLEPIRIATQSSAKSSNVMQAN
ncbi:MAG: hypothetical protein AAF539_09860 [Planctomycetota bacterium]